MDKLIGAIGALFVYFCIATVLTAGVVVTVLTLQGYLTPQKLELIVAVMHGVPLSSDDHSATQSSHVSNSLNHPIADSNTQRLLYNLDMALREQAVEKGLHRMRQLRAAVNEANERYDIKRDAFLNRLDQMKLTSEEEGLTEMINQIKNMKAPQQKEMLQRLIDADTENGMEDAVSIVKAMPDDQQKKLHKEFSTEIEEDNTALLNILREIRKGRPESSFIEETKQDFAKVSSS